MAKLLPFLISVAYWTQIHVQLILSPKTEHLDYLITQIDNIETAAEQKITDDIQFQLEYTNILSAEYVDSLNIHRFTRIVLDLSEDWEITTRLQKLAQQLEFVHVVMDKELVENPYEWSFPGLPSPTYWAEKTNVVINWLNLQRAGLSISFSQQSSQFFRYLRSISSIRLTFGFGIAHSYENILNQVARIIKPEGLTWQIVYGDGEEIEQFLRAHEEKHIAGKGRGFIIIGDSFTYLSSDSTSGINYTGGLYVIESGVETANGSAEISKYRIVNAMVRIARSQISCVLNVSVGSDLSPTCLKTQFKGAYYDTSEQLVSGFSLFNAQNGVLVKVSDIGDTISSQVQIVYPGNQEIQPEDTTPLIEFVYLGGHLNNPRAYDRFAEFTHVGGQVAYDEISANTNIMQNYKFMLNLVEIGGGILNTEALTPFLQQASTLGYAYIGGFSYDFANTFEDLQKENPDIVKPNLYSNIFASTFTDQNTYPYLTRLSINNQDRAEIFSRIMVLFQWNRIIYISSERPEYIDLKDQIFKSAAFFGYEIVLDEHIPHKADVSNFEEDYADMIDRIIDSKVRIIVTQDYDQDINFKLYETLYKRGFKPGDYIPIYNGRLFDIPALIDKYSENFEETMKFFQGSISYSQARFMGEIGENLEIQSTAILGNDRTPLPGSWYEYDAMYTLAYAFDSALLRGQDYEVSEKLNDDIRSQRFTGCSGFISFRGDSNDRSLPAFLIFQSEYENKSIRNIMQVEFDPLDGQEVTFHNDFFWADGSSTPSDTFDESSQCPFPMDDIEPTPTGQNLSIAICYSIFGISTIIAIFIWRRFWNVKILPLTSRVEYSSADLLLTVTLVIEFCQYITTGPDFSQFAYALYVIGNTLSADLEEIVILKDGLFNMVVDVCMGLTALLVILYIFKVSGIKKRYPNNYYVQGFQKISDFLLPILDDILFLPIMQIFLEVFVCIETSGDDRYDMFLFQDCYLNCWTGTHLYYVIASGICVACYVPIAIYLRPIWQELELELNVISSPAYLMVKSVFQIMIVALQKTLGRIKPYPFSWVYLIVFGAYFTFLCKIKPFNYDRFCLWERISALAVIWLTAMSVLHAQVDDSSMNQYFTIGLFVGWLILGLIGHLIQTKYKDTLFPSLLFFHKSENYAHMIKFQFSNDSEAQDFKDKLEKKLIIQQMIRQAKALQIPGESTTAPQRQAVGNTIETRNPTLVEILNRRASRFRSAFPTTNQLEEITRRMSSDVPLVEEESDEEYSISEEEAYQKSISEEGVCPDITITNLDDTKIEESKTTKSSFDSPKKMPTHRPNSPLD